MSFTIRQRSAVAAAAVTLAALIGAGGAAAQTAQPLASVQVGPIASAVATTQAGPLSIDLATPAVGPTTASADVDASAQLAALQGRLSAGRRQLTAAVQSGSAKVRSLRARVASLRRQATRLAARVQQNAIAQAQASADGTWLVVNSAGVVVDQSGGMTVNQVGTGMYDVTFGSGAGPCLSGTSDSQVQITGPNGPVNGGFFLAATGC